MGVDLFDGEAKAAAAISEFVAYEARASDVLGQKKAQANNRAATEYREIVSICAGVNLLACYLPPAQRLGFAWQSLAVIDKWTPGCHDDFCAALCELAHAAGEVTRMINASGRFPPQTKPAA